MKNKSAILTLAFLFFFAFSNIESAYSYPTMTFNILYNTSNSIALLGGEQWECKDKNFEDTNFRLQEFTCQNNSCHSSEFNYLPYQRLILNFSDKTRESQIFHADSYNAIFDVRVTDSALIVRETTPIISRGSLPFFLKALIITLILELLVAWVYLSKNKIFKRILIYIPIANLISFLLAWLSLRWIQVIYLILYTGGMFAIVFEAYFEASFIYYFNKNHISFKKSFFLSILMNGISFYVVLFLMALGLL